MESRLTYFKTSPFEQHANQVTPLSGESPSPRLGFHRSRGLESEPWGPLAAQVGSACPVVYPQAGTGKDLYNHVWCDELDSDPSEASVPTVEWGLTKATSAPSLLPCLQGRVYLGCKPWATQLQSLGIERSEVGNGAGSSVHPQGRCEKSPEEVLKGHPAGALHSLPSKRLPRRGGSWWAQCSHGAHVCHPLQTPWGRLHFSTLVCTNVSFYHQKKKSEKLISTKMLIT